MKFEGGPFPVTIRRGRESDVPFITNSWVAGWRSLPVNRSMPLETFKQTGKPVFYKLLRECGAIVACNPDDTDQIYGYVIAGHYPAVGRVVHWVHIKWLYRNVGLAKLLLDQVIGEEDQLWATFTSPKMGRLQHPDRPIKYSSENLTNILPLQVEPISTPLEVKEES